MNSIWQLDAMHTKRPSLSMDQSCEIAVIGGGLTGVLTAALLTEEGKRVILVEAETIGSGQTGRTTAKVTSQHGAIYHYLTNSLSPDTAAAYADANQHAVAAYRQLIRQRRIRCCWEDICSVIYSTENNNFLEEEAAAQRSAGLPSMLTKDSDLPFPTTGTIYLPHQGQFHPLRFLYALAEDLTIYEKTRVLAVEGNRLKTTGGIIDAEHIIFACHYPFINWPGGYFLRMHQERSYVLGLKNAPTLTGHYYSADHGGLSLRQAGEYLLLGGGGHRTGENTSGMQYDALRRSASLLFPESRECCCWSAQDCITADRIPYIGQFSAATPNWYIATGFGKWGMSSAMVAAELLKSMILGRDSNRDNIFSPQRLEPTASAASLTDDGIHAIKGLGKSFLFPARSFAETLPPGHGGVVDIYGKKAGVYKSSSGEIWAVDVRCPHLGCQLTWNQDEKSWDCPCHGSRFDYKGQSLNGPAQNQLTAHRLDKI